MTEANESRRSPLAQSVAFTIVALIVAGVVWNGITGETLSRLWQNLVDRPSGPMTFRVVLQPVMASIAALRDGLLDARTRDRPFVQALLTQPEERLGLMREGLISLARVTFLAIVMDTVYQILVLETFFPAEAAAVAILLCFLPYLVLRGLVGRFALARRQRASAQWNR